MFDIVFMASCVWVTHMALKNHAEYIEFLLNY